MKATYRLADPDKLEAHMTITMTVSEWRKVRSQLASKWPSIYLRTAIDQLISDADKVFMSTGTDVDP